MVDNDRDDLDRILDDGLSTYTSTEPWPGIEDRVLANVGRVRRTKRWFGWIVPIPALAAILVALAYLGTDDPQIIAPEGSTVAVSKDAPVPPVMAAKTVAKARVNAPALRNASRPTLFPTPAPMTDEERALLQLATLRPELLQDVVAYQEIRDQPVKVEPLAIKPLVIDESTED